MARKTDTDLEERLKIQEKALLDLAETLKNREGAFDEEMQEAVEELKAIKVFLSRTIPEFKKQFPDIRKKIKKAA
jgi:hypothetical protein